MGGIDMKLLKASEICSLYNISRRSLYRWVRLGMVNVVRTPGGHLRFDEDEVKKLFSEKKNQRTAGQTQSPIGDLAGSYRARSQT
jgi:excisionase family DNA binding protein